MTPEPQFGNLLSFLARLPAIHLPAGLKSIGSGSYENRNWWVKFHFDTKHNLAWRHVQELGCVLNYLSLNDRLPTRFYPVSPAPYLNGGEEFLSWIIESTETSFTPDNCAEWLEGRLPSPVDDLESWVLDFDEENDS